jgi:hypothetical protein
VNALTLSLAVTACAFVCASEPCICAAPEKPVTLGTRGFVVEKGRVASLVGNGLPLEPGARASTDSPQPGLGASTYSDARLKTDIRTLAGALTAVQSLRGVSFRWDPAQFGGRTVPAGRQIGFIAQEAQRILPEVVTTDDRGYLNIQYANVVPVLVEAIKEQQKQIDAKNAAIEKLRSDADEAVRDLQTRLADVEDALTRLMSANTASTTQVQWHQISPGVWRQY